MNRAAVSCVPNTVQPFHAPHRAAMPLLRLAGGLGVLVLIGQIVGAAPFRDGLDAVTAPAIVAVVALTVMTTLCSAWRWRVLARGLGITIPLPGAVGAYYRSQFLNSVLPGGVVGDVHRAVAQGRRAGDVGRGLRAVGWERFGGQLVQAVVTAVVLLALPSPVRSVLPVILTCAVGAGLVGLLGMRAVARRGGSRLTRAARAVLADLRHGLFAREVWPQLTLASVLVVAGHTTTFILAARLAGCTAPTGDLLALAMLVQTAMVIPLSIGGWGLREGAAAWAFAAAGLGASMGVTVTTVYGVLALLAVVPGAALLMADATRHTRVGTPARTEPVDDAPLELEAIGG